MSCNQCYNYPCCCSQTVTTTTTSTTTTCVGGEPCDVGYTSDCTVYSGPDLPCYGIKTGDSLTDIIQVVINLLNQYYPQCTTTTTTTTSTTSTSTTTSSTTTTTTTLDPNCNNCLQTYQLPLPGDPGVIVDGVTITGSSTQTDSLGAYSVPVYLIPSCLPDGFYQLTYGGGLAPGNPSGSYTSWNYTLNFSQPVYSATIRIINYSSITQNGSIENQEGVYFTTDAGVPDVIACSACDVIVTGNLIKADLTYDPQGYLSAINGSGSFLISSVTPFNSLTLTPFQGATDQDAYSSGVQFDICAVVV